MIHMNMIQDVYMVHLTYYKLHLAPAKGYAHCLSTNSCLYNTTNSFTYCTRIKEFGNPISLTS